MTGSAKCPARARGLVALLFLGALVSLQACQRGTIYLEDGGTDPAREQFLIDSLRIEGSSAEASAVEVEGVVDGDGVVDLSWWVEFLLVGGNGSNSLPADDGRRQSHTLRVKATRSSDGQEFYKRVKITFYD